LSKQLNIKFEESPKVFSPSFEFESKFSGVVAGIDEVGIGSWVGPVMAAAVVLQPGTPKGILDVLNDSKKLTGSKREQIYKQLTECPDVIYSIGQADVTEIDALNIRQATFLAMQRAFESLQVSPVAALVDGNARPGLSCPTQMIVKGDQRSYSIAAASIIAKVERDHLIKEYAIQFPHYGWDKNAGYGTKQHKEALLRHGITKHHRLGYAPIKNLQAL
jgi:ribonuclease HII